MSVMILSIDGMRPDFYLSPEWNAPTLKRLAKQGAQALAARPVYPTVTLTNHVTLVTGMRSAAHGIYGNTLPETDDGDFRRWHTDSRDIRVPTLWDAAREAGLKVVLIRWPVSDNANVLLNIPEVFSTDGDDQHTWELTRSRSTPGLVTGPAIRRAEFDTWVTEKTIEVLRETKPDLLLVHLYNVDHEQHEHGRDSEQAHHALEETDRLVESISGALDFTHDTLLLVGDHGMLDITHRFHVFSFFRDLGWIQVQDGKIRDWKVLPHQNCGQAPIYVRDPALEKPVLEALRARAPGLFRILDREALRDLGAFPEALCAIDMEEGYSMGQCLSGPYITPIGKTRGEHGYLNTYEKIQGGLIAVGPRIPAGITIPRVEMQDIAPTVARLLSISFPECEGKSLLRSA